MRTGLPLASWSGLAAGPAAWAVTFAINYTLVPWQCGNGVRLTPLISAIGIAIALAGMGLSYQAYQARERVSEPPLASHTRRFVAGLGTATGGLFALVMILQLAAGLFFLGCER
jgi:branched-subunit amino acid ABC-type transport system permease component